MLLRCPSALLAQVPGVPLPNEDGDGDFGIEGPEALPNFGKVGPGSYRSGQPNREGLAKLAALGVKPIVSIREKVDGAERDEASRLGMTVIHIPMSGLTAPSYAEADKVVALLADPARGPIAVHCRFGKDRTGFSVAAFRVARERMAIDAAEREAKSYNCCVFTFGSLKNWLEGYLKPR